ncbi:DUF2856 family protein [Escherichia coli]
MVTIVWKESKGTAKSRYKARRAELIAERRSNEALARKIALKLSGCVKADKAASLGILCCKKKEERERIYQTSIRPFRKATYTHFPEYIDPRLRNYRSRYGAISND